MQCHPGKYVLHEMEKKRDKFYSEHSIKNMKMF